MTPLEGIIIGSVIAALTYLFSLVSVTAVLAFRSGGRREESLDDRDAWSVSRFTIPVSLLVPVREASPDVSTTLAALLDLNYPELEVIVVAEGLRDDQVAALKHEWLLEAREFYYRQSLSTAPVRRIYRSVRDERLMIVEKTAVDSRADALNCGVNLARFRYVSAVDPGIVFDADALLRAMSAPLRNPAGVVAATSHLETDRIESAPQSSEGLHSALQRLSSVRSLMESRLVWRALQAALGPNDAVTVWRRDAVVQLGGFSVGSADPDRDMMVRLQTPTTTGQAAGRVVRSAEIFGRVPPRSVGSTVRLRARRQLAALQTLWPCRKLQRRTFAYLVLSEVLTPLAQAWIVLATVAGAVSGWLPWTAAASAVVLLSFGNAIMSSLALLVRGASARAPDEVSSKHLLLVAPLDFVVRGVVAAYARTIGFWALRRGALSAGLPA